MADKRHPVALLKLSARCATAAYLLVQASTLFSQSLPLTQSKAKAPSPSLPKDPFSELDAVVPGVVTGIVSHGREEKEESEKSSQEALVSAELQAMTDKDERAVVAYLKALAHLEKGEAQLASALLKVAVQSISQDSALRSLFQLKLIESTSTKNSLNDSLNKIKTLARNDKRLIYWRAEQFESMIELLMKSNQPKLLLKTWREYEEKVRPSQRNQGLIERFVSHITAKDFIFSKELIEVLESLASYYPYSVPSKFAFQKLQSFQCEGSLKTMKYIPSQWFISRLIGNAALDPGLRAFVHQAVQGPIRLSSGQLKEFDLLERAQLLNQLRMYDEAISLLRGYLDESYADHISAERVKRARATLILGQSHARLHQWEPSALAYMTYMNRYSDVMDPGVALEGLADALSRMRLHKASASIYAQLAQRSGVDPIVRWHHFWNLYLAKDYTQALALLDRNGYVPDRDRGIDGGLSYWRARIYERMGRSLDAKGLFQQILVTNSDSIYGIMVQTKNPDLREASHGVKPTLQNKVEELMESEGVLEEGLGAKLLEKSVTDSSHGITDLTNAQLLQKWGHYKLARKTARAITWSSINSKESFFKVADTLFSLQDFGFGLKVAAIQSSPFRNVPSDIRGLKDHMKSFNKEWTHMYPLAYERMIRKLSDAVLIDPFLILSIMRAESVYDQDARSVVGAQGLMQIMPFTAIRISRLMQDDVFSLGSLHEPEVNVSYGSFYLRKLYDYYDGNIMLTIAAYNAGPTAVDRWLSTYGDLENDEFLESISFKETRRYVKTVLRNLNQYHNIYSEKTNFISLPKLPPSKKEMEMF